MHFQLFLQRYPCTFCFLFFFILNKFYYFYRLFLLLKMLQVKIGSDHSFSPSYKQWKIHTSYFLCNKYVQQHIWRIPQDFIKISELTEYISCHFCFLICSIFAPSFTPLGVSRIYSPETVAVIQANHFCFSLKIGLYHACPKYSLGSKRMG